MINNYYTLRALADELRRDLVSSVIEACYTNVSDTLEILTTKPDGRRNVVVVSCKPKANRIFMRSAPRRHAGANVFRAAQGRTVASFESIPGERVLVSIWIIGNPSSLIFRSACECVFRKPEPRSHRCLPQVESRTIFLSGIRHSYGWTLEPGTIRTCI